MDVEQKALFGYLGLTPAQRKKLDRETQFKILGDRITAVGMISVCLLIWWLAING